MRPSVIGKEPQVTAHWALTGQAPHGAAAIRGLHSVTWGQSLSCSAKEGTAEGQECTQPGRDR